MKLKTWLLATYFVVMLLPLIVAYLLFAWIQSYNNEQKVAEYIHTSSKIQEITSKLRSAELYHPQADRRVIENLSDEHVIVELYHRDGFLLYTSNVAFHRQSTPLSNEQLYVDLYTLKQGYQSFSYKEPVFTNNEIVGFFQVHFPRDEWQNAVTTRSVIMVSVFIALFILMCAFIIYFVNKKVNRRLQALMEEMTNFAEGKQVKETDMNNDEIGQLKAHFYAMRRQILSARETIEKEQQEKEYMIATLSHDLKTPLTSIQAYAEALANERGLTKNEQEEYREIIVEKANFMKQMLDDLLTYTLLQSPTYEIEFVEVDGMEFFEMLLSGYEPLCKEKNIELHTICNVDGAYTVHPKQLIRVVDNLMSNAIQHTEAGKSVWLAALTNKKEVEHWLFDFTLQNTTFEAGYSYLIVQNEGIGIDAEALERVFEPLYQADQARTKKDARGTGLGLSIAKQIIERHGGAIQIFSKQDKGTCVICRIPKKKK